MTAGRPHVDVRRGGLEDEPFLWSMLAEASAWRPGQPAPSIEVLRGDEHLARYLDDWGRDGDRAFVGEAAGERLGAAWCRRFTADRPGYGFIDGSIPELAIGVVARHRGEGVGTRLLQALIEDARARDLEALSLSVEDGNPARHLYARMGFVEVPSSPGAATMRLDLSTSRKDIR